MEAAPGGHGVRVALDLLVRLVEHCARHARDGHHARRVRHGHHRRTSPVASGAMMLVNLLPSVRVLAVGVRDGSALGGLAAKARSLDRDEGAAKPRPAARLNGRHLELLLKVEVRLTVPRRSEGKAHAWEQDSDRVAPRCKGAQGHDEHVLVRRPRIVHGLDWALGLAKAHLRLLRQGQVDVQECDAHLCGRGVVARERRDGFCGGRVRAREFKGAGDAVGAHAHH
mmetsp:Transcript_17652/g.55003  ORF Transcript_17652/g.55003 Transcript_17652/m.55003 type:complete len:226 (+) Transcript_17652:2032-2709(+)